MHVVQHDIEYDGSFTKRRAINCFPRNTNSFHRTSNGHEVRILLLKQTSYKSLKIQSLKLCYLLLLKNWSNKKVWMQTMCKLWKCHIKRRRYMYWPKLNMRIWDQRWKTNWTGTCYGIALEDNAEHLLVTLLKRLESHLWTRVWSSFWL